MWQFSFPHNTFRFSKNAIYTHVKLICFISRIPIRGVIYNVAISSEGLKFVYNLKTSQNAPKINKEWNTFIDRVWFNHQNLRTRTHVKHDTGLPHIMRVYFMIFCSSKYHSSTTFTLFMIPQIGFFPVSPVYINAISCNYS